MPRGRAEGLWPQLFCNGGGRPGVPDFRSARLEDAPIHHTRAVGRRARRERAKALADLRAAEADALNNVGWVDQGKGVVRLPIAEAMKLVERKWQNPPEARKDLIARVEKATALPPKAPEKPSAFE